MLTTEIKIVHHADGWEVYIQALRAFGTGNTLRDAFLALGETVEDLVSTRFPECEPVLWRAFAELEREEPAADRGADG